MTKPSIEVQIEIDSFRVRNYQAFLVASFQVTKDEYPVFEKSYTVMGSRRVQQNDSDTAFEGKQAVDLSIDEVMRSLFEKFLKDARSASLTW